MNNKFRFFNKPIKFTIGILLCCILSAAVAFATIPGRNDFGLGSSAELLLGLSADQYSVPLGSSYTEISSVEDLQKLAKDVNAGETFEGKSFLVTTDLDLSELPEWTPIGDVLHPFSGIFDGGGYQIRGLGDVEHPALFGYTKQAVLQNIVLRTKQQVTGSELYAFLVKTAESTTITNCQVIPANTYSRGIFLSRSNLQPDTSWYSARSTNFSLGSAEQLLGLAQLVENGVDNFSGKHIQLQNISMFGVDGWVGVGSPENPFSGSVSGVVRNLTISENISNTGLFGYAVNAEFKNLFILDANVKGFNRVGGLAGYAEDTTITECYVTGTVTGVSEVGGLVGHFNLIDKVRIEPPVTNSYSAAEVTGTDSIGGLIGRTEIEPNSTFVYLDNCFTTSRVSGSIAVGGIVGHNTFGSLTHVAASGKISGSALVGGIIGASDAYWHLWGGDSNEPLTEFSYFAGEVSGVSQVAGITGGLYPNERHIFVNVVGSMNMYVSGHVIAPVAFNHPQVWPWNGDEWNLDYPDESSSEGAWADPQVVYETGNFMNRNFDASKILWDHTNPQSTSPLGKGNVYEKRYAYTIEGNFIELKSPDFNYFTGASGEKPDGFTAHTLVYNTQTTTGDPTPTPQKTVDIQSQYPTMDSFTDSGNFNNQKVRDAFAVFSEMSTKVKLMSLPTKFIRTDSGELASKDSPNSVFTLETIVDGKTLNWKCSVDNIADSTLPAGNVLSVNNGVMHLQNALVEDLEVTMVASVDGVPLDMTYTFTIEDGTARPVYEELVKHFQYTKAEAADPTARRLSPTDYLFTLPFTENIEIGTGRVLLQEYDSDDFTNPSARIVPVATSVVGNDTLRLQWPMGAVRIGKSYKLHFEQNGVRDMGGNEQEETDYYFLSVSNIAPKLEFDQTHPLATTTAADGSTQTMRFIENSPEYMGVIDGLLEQTNESHILLENNAVKSFKVLQSVAGTMPYTEQPNVDNFHLIPGLYEVSYEINDPEDPTVQSNIAVRTYQVYGRGLLTKGGALSQNIALNLSADEMVDILNMVDKQGTDLNQAISQVLTKKYINTSNPTDQIGAFYYDHDLSKKPLQIKFLPTKLDSSVFQKGTETMGLLETADGAQHIYLLSLAGIAADKMIMVDHNNFTTTNTFSKAEARRYFNARVYDKRAGQITNEPVYYNFKDINTSNYDTAQEVVISLTKNNEPNYVGGVDLNTAVTVTVTIKKEELKKQRISPADERKLYWETAMEHVRRSKKDRTIHFYASYNDGEAVPADFFRALKNKDHVTVKFNYASGIRLAFSSESINNSLIDRLFYNINIEPAYDMKVNRDADGMPTQQFVSQEKVVLPAKMALIVPLEKQLQTYDDLYLYTIDIKGNYEFVRKITARELESGKLALSITKLEGHYVVTPAVLGEHASTTAQGIPVSTPVVSQNGVEKPTAPLIEPPMEEASQSMG